MFGSSLSITTNSDKGSIAPLQGLTDPSNRKPRQKSLTKKLSLGLYDIVENLEISSMLKYFNKF